MLAFGSLFAGIGGIDLGFEQAGMKCKWQVEIDDYANKVLEKHYPEVKRYRDIRKCGKHNLEPVDVIAGGFPCQDVSTAGKGEGIKEGTRSGLWFEMRRIICELQPRYVFVENVPGLLVRGMGTVLGDLSSIGYTIEWQRLSARQFGAWHLRRRIWIVAYSDGSKTSRHREYSRKILSKSKSGRFNENNSISNTKITKCQSTGTSRTGGNGFTNGYSTGEQYWSTEPDVGRVAHGVPNRVDRLKCLGNAVVPQCAEYVGRLIVEHAEYMANNKCTK